MKKLLIALIITVIATVVIIYNTPDKEHKHLDIPTIKPTITDTIKPTATTHKSVYDGKYKNTAGYICEVDNNIVYKYIEYQGKETATKHICMISDENTTRTLKESIENGRCIFEIEIYDNGVLIDNTDFIDELSRFMKVE